MACSELAGEEKTHNRTLPRDGRAPARPAKKLALAARLRSGPHRHEDVRPPESVVRRGAERSAAIYRVSIVANNLLDKAHLPHLPAITENAARLGVPRTVPMTEFGSF